RSLDVGVVVGRHLAVAYDRELAQLARVEPRLLDVTDHATRELEHEERNVLQLTVEDRELARADADGQRAEQVDQDRDVVRPEVPERVQVLADDSEVDALAVDVEDLPEP